MLGIALLAVAGLRASLALSATPTIEFTVNDEEERAKILVEVQSCGSTLSCFVSKEASRAAGAKKAFTRSARSLHPTLRGALSHACDTHKEIIDLVLCYRDTLKAAKDDLDQLKSARQDRANTGASLETELVSSNHFAGKILFLECGAAPTDACFDSNLRALGAEVVDGFGAMSDSFDELARWGILDYGCSQKLGEDACRKAHPFPPSAFLPADAAKIPYAPARRLPGDSGKGAHDGDSGNAASGTAPNPGASAQPAPNPGASAQPAPNPAASAQPAPNPAASAQPAPNPAASAQPAPVPSANPPQPVPPRLLLQPGPHHGDGPPAAVVPHPHGASPLPGASPAPLAFSSDGVPLDCGPNAPLPARGTGPFGDTYFTLQLHARHFACYVKEHSPNDPSTLFMAEMALRIAHMTEQKPTDDEAVQFFSDLQMGVAILLEDPTVPGKPELTAFASDVDRLRESVRREGFNPLYDRSQLEKHFCSWRAALEASHPGLTLGWPEELLSCGG